MKGPLALAVVGAGWAGLAAAVAATADGHRVTLFEAAPTPGGRARAVPADAGAEAQPLDNGQHILIGAYVQTLALMRTVGVDPADVLLRLPLDLRAPDGRGLVLPQGWPAPLDVLAGVLGARGWSWRDRASLLRVAAGWQARRFRCPDNASVADLCRSLSPRVTRELVEPLCIAALNTPTYEASGSVFLRVMKDALFGERGGADLLLPRRDLSRLLPGPATAWLQARGTRCVAARVRHIVPRSGGWDVDGQPFDRVVLACPPGEAARLVAGALPASSTALAWCESARALRFEAIATVYATAPQGLPRPMVALPGDPLSAPAQFVFDRGRLGGPHGLLAFVASASRLERDALEQAVVGQAQRQLGLPVQPVQTIVEKRATFACTPGLQRPPAVIAPGLLACGDYIVGPYPATLEGAVRSGHAAAASLSGSAVE